MQSDSQVFIYRKIEAHSSFTLSLQRSEGDKLQCSKISRLKEYHFLQRTFQQRIHLEDTDRERDIYVAGFASSYEVSLASLLTVFIFPSICDSRLTQKEISRQIFAKLDNLCPVGHSENAISDCGFGHPTEWAGVIKWNE
ncbi:hypothetical protein TNCV_4380291 [Trichonephila clavipes]|nr:hypothetical protein TNCV_4380291 [Trichonephila clavipes]